MYVCLITLAGWFSRPTVSKKFNPRSIFLIPTPPCGMLFNGYACVCASKGSETENGRYRNEDLVEKSAEVVRRLVVQHCMPKGWEKVRHLYSQFSGVQNLLI
jgi:hypothetical protein